MRSTSSVRRIERSKNLDETLPYHLTRRARRDLLAIWNYLREHASIEVADRVLAKIYDAIQLLAAQPGLGHERADVEDPRYRFWSVYNYIIAYRLDRKPFTVARVVHGARDFRKLFT
jgi:antitoxin ParD1/3/4/toxin ParE1/3/4